MAKKNTEEQEQEVGAHPTPEARIERLESVVAELQRNFHLHRHDTRGGHVVVPPPAEPPVEQASTEGEKEEAGEEQSQDPIDGN